MRTAKKSMKPVQGDIKPEEGDISNRSKPEDDDRISAEGRESGIITPDGGSVLSRRETIDA